jgi:hypothetical protein
MEAVEILIYSAGVGGEAVMSLLEEKKLPKGGSRDLLWMGL